MTAGRLGKAFRELDRVLSPILTSRRSGQTKPYRPKPFVVVYFLVLFLGVICAWAAYWALITWIPGARNNSLDALKTSLAVVAGSGAAAALYVSYRKQRNDEANSVREHDRLFTDRFTKASEQLGHEAAAVRLAGMYALARIADDSDRDRETCMKVICAYLRMPYDPDDPHSDPSEHNVRSTALQLVEERLRPSHPHFWEGAEVDLRGAALVNAAFSRTVIRKAIFVDAKFYGETLFGVTTFAWRTFFDNARFHGEVWFGHSEFNDQVTFKGAHFYTDVRFHQAKFKSPVTYFDGANFDGEAEFSGAEFSSSGSFEGTNFKVAPKWPRGYQLTQGKLVRVI